jgi:hypothetical protein
VANALNDTWKQLSHGTYHFRVCLLKNKNCALYSNDVSVQIKPEDATGITLNYSQNDGQVNLSWTANNLTEAQGFKTIISLSPNLTFPGDNHHLILNNNAKSDVWDNLESGQTYYFRVCQNIANACGIYSNEIKIIIN